MSEKQLSKEEYTEITELLSSLGLHENDQKVYIELLKRKDGTLTPLALATKLPLTTVQSIAERLAGKGLLHVTTRKSRKVYEAYNPSVLSELLKRQLEEVSRTLPLLQKLKDEPEFSNKIRIYRNERMRDIFFEALQTKQKVIYEIVAAKELQNILGEKFHFTKRRVEKLIRLKSLRVEKQEIKAYSKLKHIKELRDARFLPRDLTFSASIMCWDNSVAFFTTSSEGIAWVIEGTTMRDTILQLFNLLWDISRPMITEKDK